MEPRPMESRPVRPTSQFEDINIIELLFVLKGKIIWIVLCAMVGAAISFTYTTYRITPLYQASLKMIVNSKRDAYAVLTVSDVTSAESLVATYAAVIKSNRVLDRVIEKLELNMGWTSLNGMIAVNPVNNTPVMNIVVTNPDPEMARRIVNTIAEVAPAIIVDAVEAGSCKVISDAYCSGWPVSPNVRQNTMKGMAVGAMLCAGVVVLFHLLNDNVRSEEQLAELTGVPVLSSIPLVGKGTKSKKHRRKRKHRRKEAEE